MAWRGLTDAGSPLWRHISSVVSLTQCSFRCSKTVGQGADAVRHVAMNEWSVASRTNAVLGSSFASVSQAPGPSPLQQLPEPMQTPQPGAGLGVFRTARAVKRQAQISPKKLQVVAKLVRRMHVDDAMRECELIPKKAARIVREVLKSARANAENNHGLRLDALKVDECFVTKGRYLERTWWHGRGKVGRRTRYYSHLTVILKETEKPERKVKLSKALLERPSRAGGKQQPNRERLDHI